MQMHVPVKPLSRRRDRERTDPGKMMAVPHSLRQDRRLAGEGPGLLHHGVEHKPHFIQEHEVRVAASGFFLDTRPVMAHPAFDSGLIPLRGPAFRLLRGKNQALSRAWANDRRDNGRHNVVRSPAARAGRSTCRWESPPTWRLRICARSSLLFVRRRARMGTCWCAWPPAPPRREPDSLATAAGRSGDASPCAGRPPETRNRLSAAPRPCGAAVRAVERFHTVSCNVITANRPIEH